MWGIKAPGSSLIVSSRVRHEIVILLHKRRGMSIVRLQRCYDEGVSERRPWADAALPLRCWHARMMETSPGQSRRLPDGPLAHRVEQGTFNPKVPGSSPGRPTRSESLVRRVGLAASPTCPDAYGRASSLTRPLLGCRSQWSDVLRRSRNGSPRDDECVWPQHGRLASDRQHGDFLHWAFCRHASTTGDLRTTGPPVLRCAIAEPTIRHLGGLPRSPTTRSAATWAPLCLTRTL